MNFDDETAANENENKTDNQSEHLWSKISQLITGNEHDEKQFKLLISKLNDYDQQRAFRGHVNKLMKRSVRRMMTQQKTGSRALRVKKLNT